MLANTNGGQAQDLPLHGQKLIVKYRAHWVQIVYVQPAMIN